MPDGSPTSQEASPPSSADSPPTYSEMFSPSSVTGHARVLRVLTNILLEEFDVRLGVCEPPEMLNAVSECLDRIFCSLDYHRVHQYLVPFTSAPISNDGQPPMTWVSAREAAGASALLGFGKKRGVSATGNGEDGGLQDDGPDGDNGGACLGSRGTGDRKRTKSEEFSCPFRKRNPLRFNVRDWEYCAKGAFRSITDLKYVMRVSLCPMKNMDRS